MKISELLEDKSSFDPPLVWKMVRKLLASGQKVYIRGAFLWSKNGPDKQGILRVTRAETTGSGETKVPIIYFKPERRPKTWVEIVPEDDQELELIKQKDGSFLLQYIDPDKWITA